MALPLPRQWAMTDSAAPTMDQMAALMQPACHELDAYLRPDYGWSAAVSMYRYGMRGTGAFDGRAKWVWRAWKCLQGGLANEATDNRFFVQWAWKIRHDPAMQINRSTLEGALIIAGATRQSAASFTGLDIRVVEAYETLFWNVLDRTNDLYYLQSLIYPGGRLEEMVNNYINEANISALLQRIGYNSGGGDLAWGAGLRLHPVDSTSIEIAKEQNERLTLSLGALMLRNWGHHARPHYTVSGSRGLLQAAKLGGTDSGATGFDDSFSEFAEGIFGKDVAVLEARIEEQLKMQGD